MSLEMATSDAPPTHSTLAWPPWAISISVAIFFFLAARLSLALLDKTDGIAVFWPAAGVATGFLVAFGSTVRWQVVIGVGAATFAANLLGDRNLASTTVFAVANASSPVIAAGLIQRFYGAPFELNELRRVFGLIGAAIIAAIVCGFMGALGFAFFHPSASSAVTIWRHLVASDTLGTITVAPLVIGLASFLRNAPPRREIAEETFALAIVATLCLLLVFLPHEPWTLELAIASLCPLFVWIAARVRPAFMAVATFMCAITIVWTTIFAVGLFGDTRLPLEERILSAQATILATSFGALVLAALFSERRIHEFAILEREHRLEEALRAGGVITFDWDVRIGLIRLSQNAAEILGLGPRQSLSSAEWVRQIHPDDRPSVTTRLNMARPDEHSHSMTFRFLRPDGRGEVWLEQIAVTHFDAGGMPTRINGLTTDVTERMRFEEEISRAWKSAALADQAKTSFLSAASHDLRQPLQTLRFLHAALEPHLPDGEGRNLVGGIARSLDTMSSILSSLLEAMLRNLLSNAVRYTDRGTILLGCRRAGDKIRIEVWDSGVGISQDQLPHIFQEYYQGAHGAERGGFGLGLAIVRRMGKILEHRIDVRSTPGRGTVFSIEVPRGDSSRDTMERARTPRFEREDFPDR